jgi:1-acylglycerone phosphate reductase
VTSDESILALRKEMEARTNGSLDILVNNAGRNYTVPALDVNTSEIREVFETNVFAVMRMCQIFAPLLIQGKGTIVNIGSLSGVMPHPFSS